MKDVGVSVILVIVVEVVVGGEDSGREESVKVGWQRPEAVA